MSITLKSMFEQLRGEYQLKLLASSDWLEHNVTWVHMTEDSSVTEFFWGNEVVVTSGYLCRTTSELIKFIDELTEHNCAGLVINIGKYIDFVDKEVIAYCEEEHLPLITMPWNKSMTEFVRNSCSLIDKSNLNDDVLAQAILRLIMYPQEAGVYEKVLSEKFNIAEGMIITAIRTDMTEGKIDQRSILRLHTALRDFSFSCLIFRYEKQYIVVLNCNSTDLAIKGSMNIVQSFKEVFNNRSVNIGIGECVYAFENLNSAFNSAISAVRCARLQNKTIICFKDMSFLKLLYSVPDHMLLQNYYYETVGKIIDYEKTHNNSYYLETLFRYLLCDGKVQSVANSMYTHRNTVNYRMNKIREILNCDLQTESERLPYIIAYYCGVILKIIPAIQGLE